MRKDRAAGIVIYNDKLLVMYRKNTKEYYVFPGGGVEDNETNEQAVIRELKEETSIDVEIDKLLFKLKAPEGEMHHYFVCKYKAGIPKLNENTNEFKEIQNGSDYFEPIWMDLDKISGSLIFPNIAKSLLLNYLDGMNIDPKEIHMHD